MSCLEIYILDISDIKHDFLNFHQPDMTSGTSDYWGNPVLGGFFTFYFYLECLENLFYLFIVIFCSHLDLGNDMNHFLDVSNDSNTLFFFNLIKKNIYILKHVVTKN